MVDNGKIVGVIHIGAMGVWEDIFNDQLKTIDECGLLAKCDKIYVGVSGPKITLPQGVDLISHNEVLEKGENPTLLALHQLCQKMPPTKIFYIHTKGASFDGKTLPDWAKNNKKLGSPETVATNVLHWRKYLEYFILEKHEQCIKALDTCDACGVEWKQKSRTSTAGTLPPHFSGNFWWANSEHIARIQNPFEFQEKACSKCGSQQPRDRNSCWMCGHKKFNDIDRVPATLPPRYAAEFCFIGRENPKIKCFHTMRKRNLYKNRVKESDYIIS
tara:strand:- start:139 stop:957 length:819 start_codon:yes stop_codon:yes gene_type:complete